MKSNYKKLGNYIREVDNRNADGALGENDLYGISVTKDFIISHANLVGVTFENYKVVESRQFAYIPDTSRRGDKIAISLNSFENKIIVSSIYSVFEIKDENELLPDFLMLWFMRPDFDRYARFMSNGSAREIFDWDSMCGVEIPVPPIDEQRKIVHAYKVITDRISLLKKINDNLEDATKTLYKQTINSKTENDLESIYSILKVINGSTFSSEAFNTNQIGYPLIRIRDLSTCNPDVYTYEVLNNMEYIHCGDILIGMDGEFIPHIWFGDVGVLNQRVCKVVPVESFIHPLFLYWTLKPILAEIQRTQGGTTVIHIGKKDFDKMQSYHISREDHLEYKRKVEPIFNHILNNYQETLKLAQMQSLLLSKLSR